MDTDHLVKMANQIGSFFATLPDRQEALEGVATHIKKFWDPRMRLALLQRIDQGSTEDISDIVLAAVQQHRDSLTPKEVTP